MLLSCYATIVQHRASTGVEAGGIGVGGALASGKRASSSLLDTPSLK